MCDQNWQKKLRAAALLWSQITQIVFSMTAWVYSPQDSCVGLPGLLELPEVHSSIFREEPGELLQGYGFGVLLTELTD